MQEIIPAGQSVAIEPKVGSSLQADDVVSTHVLVPEEHVLKLRELSRRTRIPQSEYLREAVDDLLAKYGRGAELADTDLDAEAP